MGKRLTLGAAALLLPLLAGPLAAAGTSDPALIAQGHRVAVAADCAACHTANGGAEMAGGRPIESPLGTIWSTNITPSRRAGIGDWSEADFSRAVRHGVRRDGAHLYPAMPYDAYAGITDADLHALYAYFMQGVAPVDAAPAQVTALPFPFGIRASMAGWNLLFARVQPFEPDPKLTEEQNRGAYLGEALAHCASCHTPRGLLMQGLGGQALAGGQVGRWYAPNITPDASGIGDWSEAEIAQYLAEGRLAGRAQAGGPMAEAVTHSFQHMPPEDLQAIAAWLKTVPAVQTATAHAPGGPLPEGEAELRGTAPFNAHDSIESGASLYAGYCASCHQPDGAGSTNQAYPSLVENSVTKAASPTNLIATMLDGVDREVGETHVLMPAFGPGSYVSPLSDTQIAKIATYVRARYGNGGAAVTPETVAEVRAGGPLPLLARAQPWMAPGLIAAAVVVLLLLAALVVLVRRRRG